MLLTPLWDTDTTSAIWQVYAISDEVQCPVVDLLEKSLGDRSVRAHAEGIMAIIEHLTSGQMEPNQLLRNSSLCHEAVYGTRIFRIRKGVLRLYWFYGDKQKIIICPHAEVKRQNSVSKSTRQLLISSQESYAEASAAGKIVILNNGGNHE